MSRSTRMPRRPASNIFAHNYGLPLSRLRPTHLHTVVRAHFKQSFVGSNFSESAKPLPSRYCRCIALFGRRGATRRAPILRNRCCLCRLCRLRRQIFAAETSVSPKSRASQPGAGATAFSIQPHSVSFISYFSLSRSPLSLFHSFTPSFICKTNSLSLRLIYGARFSMSALFDPARPCRPCPPMTEAI